MAITKSEKKGLRQRISEASKILLGREAFDLQWSSEQAGVKYITGLGLTSDRLSIWGEDEDITTEELENLDLSNRYFEDISTRLLRAAIPWLNANTDEQMRKKFEAFLDFYTLYKFERKTIMESKEALGKLKEEFQEYEDGRKYCDDETFMAKRLVIQDAEEQYKRLVHSFLITEERGLNLVKFLWSVSWKSPDDYKVYTIVKPEIVLGGQQSQLPYGVGRGVGRSER